MPETTPAMMLMMVLPAMQKSDGGDSQCRTPHPVPQKEDATSNADQKVDHQSVNDPIADRVTP